MISLDCETTGVDFHHGARPFFVTISDINGDQAFWEWDVDPVTREPKVLSGDLAEILDFIRRHDRVVGQNIKFDVTALRSLSPRFDDWPWDRTEDTLVASHLLASNQRHDLTSLAVHYLGWDIQPFEDRLGAAVTEARRVVSRPDFQDEFGVWSIAHHSRPDMPSCPKGDTGKAKRGEDRDRAWKSDMWLPRAVAAALGYEEGHPWWTVLQEYSNTDSEVTVALWRVFERKIRERGLGKVHRERMRLIPVVHKVEWGGVTLRRKNLEGLVTRYSAESEALRGECLGIASGFEYRVPCPRRKLKTHDSKPCPECRGEGEVDFRLNLPRGPTNGSLETFFFDVLGLKRIRGSKSKTNKPTMGAEAITHYRETLPQDSTALKFIEALVAKRARDTALMYLSSYTRYWIPVDGSPGVYILYPSLNPTGSDTLRFSSSNPNEQNISNRKMEEGDEQNIRDAFGPPPGYEWWSLDAKNIELRIPAYKSGEADQILLFEAPKEPPYYGSVHLLNFHTVYPDLWERGLKAVGFDKVGPWCKETYESSWYRWAKIGGFAIQYGAQAATADRAFRKKGCFAALKSRFKKLEALNQECIRFANRHGYIETWPDKSVDPDRGYPLMVSRTDWGDVIPTIPFNYKVQGTAMQWTCRAMVRTQQALDDWNKRAYERRQRAGYRIVAQVHDEIVFEMPRRADPRIDPKASNLGRARELARLMALGGDDIGVPTPVGVEYHPDHWGTGVTLKV